MSGPYSLLVILVTFAFAEPAEKIITPPTNVTQKSGETAQFKCQVDLELEHNMQWSFSDRIIYTYQGGEEGYPSTNTRKYLVKQNGNNFTLVIDNLRYKDGGKYTCGVLMEYEDAVLIVLEQPSLEPPMSIPIEGDTANYTCKACFGGPKKDEIAKDHYPRLIMYMDSSTSEQLLNQTEFPGKDNYCLVKVLQLTVDATMHGKQMTCEIATNKPAMKFLKSTEVNVMYSVRNITYIPNKEKYDVGSIITCIAGGNPPPTIEWKKLEGNLISSTRLNITKDMIGQHFWCTATNEIQEEVHDVNTTVLVIDVLDIDPEDKNADGSQSYIIIITVLLIMGVIFAGVSMLAYYRTRTARRQDNQTHYMPLRKTDGNHNTKSSECLSIIKALKQNNDLDVQGQNIIEMLETDGREILEDIPEIFSEMIMKAGSLIESSHYLTIIQDMTKLYKDKKQSLREGPLYYLRGLLGDAKKAAGLFTNQKNTHQFIQTLIQADENAKSKTLLLLDIIKCSEYVTLSNNNFKWSKELIATLTLLLERQADPTWIKDGWGNVKQEMRYTAQYHFLSVIYKILLSKDNCLSPIMKVLPWLLFREPSSDIRFRGTSLHALVEIDWQWLKEYQNKEGHLPRDFFQSYSGIIRQVKSTNSGLLEMEDWYGRTPLHLFMEKIEWQESILQDVVDITVLLKSKNCMGKIDKKKKTVLHYLADAYPVFSGEPSQNEKQAFLDFAIKLKSDSNVDKQDTNGQTPLHVLAKKYRVITQNSTAFFFKLFKIFISESNLDIQDSNGCTVLHILAEGLPYNLQEEDFDMFYHLTEIHGSGVNIFTMDHNGQTVLHVLAKQCDRNLKERNQKTFQRLLEIFKKASFVQDKQGQTVLHILGKKLSEKPTLESDLLPIFRMLATKENVNIKDKQDVTPYSWILIEDSPELKNIFTENEADEKLAKSGLSSILESQGSEDKTATTPEKKVDSNLFKPQSEKYQEKLMRLDEYISIPKRHDYIRAYHKDLRHYLMMDEDFLFELEKCDVITEVERQFIQGGDSKIEDEQIRDMITIMWNIEENEKYLKFLDILAEEDEELVDLLTGGKWELSDD